ncbi:unnamed protein product [Linum trigynum]|uniref:Cytochrome P450 n=1 Tax=Linum trigynum TaxID=586398 RepID=A0AAV2EIG5_9ROSI
MELPFSNTLLLIISFLTLLAAIRILKRRKSSKLPPGPWRLPIIGNLHQVVGSEPPHRRLMGLAQKHGPLMHLQLGETSNVIVSSPELAKEFMKTHDLNFAFRPVFPAARILSYDARDIAFAPHGEYWRQMRKVFTQEILSAQRVESLRPVVEDEIGKLTASIRQQKVQSIIYLSICPCQYLIICN